MLHDRISELYDALSRRGIECRRNEPLSLHTTFRIGGNAAIAIFPKDEDEMCFSLRAVRESEVSLFVMGGGSNVLAPDAGFDGAVLFTGGMRTLSVSPIKDGSVLLSVGAGMPLSLFSRAAAERGLTGAEFLCGIPGTIGGAVVMNAGAYGGETAQILVSSRYADTEMYTPCERSLEAHDYGYRESIYLRRPNEMVLSAVFCLLQGDGEAIKAKMGELLAQRRAKQPLEYPSAGSFFKRPTGTFAGKLIEECGLKGYRIGGAAVSEKHAGFLVNRGGATEADVRALAAFVRETVLRETGYLLESEVQTMGGETL